MGKKFFKYSMLTFMIALASFFCTCFSNSLVNTVFANEINQKVSLSVTTNSSNFEMGTVEGYGEYPVGSTVTLTATPTEGCYFVEWKDEFGNTISNANPYSFVISGDTKIEAIFDFVEYKISDTLNYFTLKDDGLEVEENKNIAYTRGDIVNKEISGSFYFGDIVTLKYSLKDSSNFVKEFTSASFVMNRPVMLISVDKSNKILWTESAGIKDTALAGILVTEHEYDYDIYDYVIVTNINIGSKYIAVGLEFRSKINKNLNITATESNLKLIEMNAKLFENGTQTNLDMAEIEDAVSFDYGYYGQLTDLDFVEGLESTNRYYLVEPNANYKLTLSDNNNYVYKQINSNTERVITGYFDSSIIGFTLIYQRREYQISFEQIVKDGDKYLPVDQNWVDLTTVSAHAGDKVEIKFDDNKFYVYINETENVVKELLTVYGFEFFGFSNITTLDEKNTSIEYIIDADNPVGTTIYIVLTKIKYNFTFGVADINENYSEYFTSRVTNLPANGMYSRQDEIKLTANVPNGFTAKKWIIKENGTTKELAQTNFIYIPTSNNENVEVLLVIEYNYFEFSFDLDGFADDGTNVADITLSVVEYFTINSDESKLTINGTYYNNGGVSDWTYDLSQISDKTTSTQIAFTSDIGSAVVYLDGENYSYLTFAGLTYLYSNNQFRRYSDGARIDLSRTVESDLEITDTPETKYSITLTNVCIDDVIFASASLKEDYKTTFKFLHFVKINTTTNTNTALPAKTSKNFFGESVIYGSSYNATTNIMAKYVKQDGSIYVTSNNEKAFAIGDLDFTYANGTEHYIEGESYYRLEIRTDEEVTVLITKEKITKGYKFVSVNLTLKDGTQELHSVGSSNNITEETVQFKFKFTLSKNYSDCTITINFEEIVYNVNINTTATVLVFDNVNNDLLVFTPIDNSMNISFLISWSIIETQPKITVASTKGYYICNAYFKTNEDSNKVNLIGVDTEQTNKNYVFSEDDLRLIISLADEDNNVDLYLNEEKRLFEITIQYVNDKVDCSFIKDAEVTCIYDTAEGTQTLVKTATSSVGQSGTIYCATFSKIKFETTIKLSIEDSNIEGLYFSNWSYSKDNIDYSITDSEYQFILSDDILIYANFTALDYTVTFKYLNSDKTESKEITSGASLVVEKIYATYFNIGAEIQFEITEKTGYKLIDAYYIMTEIEKSIYPYLSSDGTSFYFTDESFSPSTYLTATRQNQIENKNNDRNLTIYLVFQEKLYSISTNVINSTSLKGPVYNTTNKDVEDWLDHENLIILYMVNGEYVTKEANPDDGLIYFSTNSNIKIMFNNALAGISLKSIYLGSSSYSVEGTGVSTIGGKEVSLSLETRDGIDYYVLNFSLNSAFLATCGNTSNFEVSFVYEIKKYLMTFTTNTINNNLLVKKYKLSLSYKPANRQFGQERSNSEKGSLKNATSIPNSMLYYGIENTWTISHVNSILDFDTKYTFCYFSYQVSENESIMFTPNGDSLSFGLHEEFKDQKGNSFILWDLIATNQRDQKPTIYAVYSPMISLGEDFQMIDGKYVKTVNYNGYVQALTTSYDSDIENPDIRYDKEFGEAEITYTVNQGLITEPKNSNTYQVKIKVAGISIFKGTNGELIEGVSLVINKIKLSINPIDSITKEYDGTESLTAQNIYSLQGQLSLSGLVKADAEQSVRQLDVSAISGYYADFKVGKDIDVTVNHIRLGNSLLTNYYITEDIDQVISVTFTKKGTITKKELTINPNSFTFYNIVYKAGQEYVLKYTQNGELTFRETLAGSDECYIDVTKLIYSLNDYSIGYSKSITVNLSECLDGADHQNYYINNIFYNINIHPYEIVYELENVGRFTITDLDEGCYIPIETKLDGLTVEIINSGSSEYTDLYSLIENQIRNNERLYNFYKYNIKTNFGNSVNVNNFIGAYVTFSKVKDMSSLYDVGLDAKKLDINKTDNAVVIKINENTSNTFAVIVNKSYFSIKRILLIVGLLLLLLIIVIICIVIYKKIRSKRASEKDKI